MAKKRGQVQIEDWLEKAVEARVKEGKLTVVYWENSRSLGVKGHLRRAKQPRTLCGMVFPGRGHLASREIDHTVPDMCLRCMQAARNWVSPVRDKKEDSNGSAE